MISFKYEIIRINFDIYIFDIYMLQKTDVIIHDFMYKI
jgi:hypothetical protein